MSDFSDMAVIVMAWRRPYYLRETLASWAAADGIKEIRSFVIGLGDHPRKGENLQVIAEAEQAMGRPIWILEDSPQSRGRASAMHRPMGEACDMVWADHAEGAPDAGWVILSEEDNTVSDDVLHYMRWCRDTFEDDPRVLLVCAHDLHWTEPPAENDPSVVRLRQGFASHAWGTWRDRWAEVLGPTWDYDLHNGGCDLNIARNVMPRGGYLAAAPDCSRSSNNGKDEGVNMRPEDWQQEPTFRPVYGRVAYRLGES